MEKLTESEKKVLSALLAQAAEIVETCGGDNTAHLVSDEDASSIAESAIEKVKKILDLPELEEA